MSVAANWSNDSAFNTELAKQEAQSWIEAVTGERFPSDFQRSLKNGKLLCKLINQIKPGSVKKINNQASDYAEMENISFYLQGARGLGLKETQLFTSKELHEENGRIRDVLISLYWLGRAARGVPTYKGPHLNLTAFQKMKCTKCKNPINDNNYLATMDQQWHRQCATCCKCHCALDPKEPFYQNGNDIYCHNCMVAATGGPSKGSGQGAHAGHNHGHGNECGKCHRNLNGESYVPGDDGKNYCTKCVCDSCHKPLTGKEVVKNGKKLCPECICGECSAPFGDDGFYEKGGKNVCPSCYNKTKGAQASPARSGPSSTGDSFCPSCGTKKAPGAKFCPGCGANSAGGPVNNSPSRTQPGQGQGGSGGGCKNCHKPLTNKQNKKPTGHQYCDPCANDFCCGKCGDEVVGQAIGALGKKFHPQCFNCDNCHKNIPTACGGKFQKLNDQPVCNPCYDQLAGKFGFCAGCGGKLDRNGIEALDQRWHPSCFVCQTCHKSFPNGEFAEYENMPYCPGCVPNSSPDRCHSCKQSLSGQVTSVLGKFWHQGCFKCTKCKSALIKGYHPHNNEPYCEPCFLEFNSDPCQLCKKAIVGQGIKAQNKQWHRACFNCTSCNKSLAGNDNPDVFIKFSKPYCRTCNPSNAPASPAKGGKFCGNCGTAVGGTAARFCNNCGSAV